MPPPVALTDVTEEERTLALVRFAVIRPFFEDGVPLAHLARHHHLAMRTLQRWAQQYRQAGLAGLIRRQRADRGQPRGLPSDLQQLIEGLALQTPPPSVAHVHRLVAPIAAQHGWPVPSYDVVYAIVRALDPALLTLAHDGTNTYRDTFDLLHRREAACPNDIWQADHTLLDVWLHSDDGPPARPWLTIILDDYSRAVAGYRLSFHTPSALTTALTLRHAIWRKPDPQWHVCGIPATLYTDHGSDFTSTHLEQVSADLKMRLVFSQRGRPRGRGRIERFFHTVNQRFLCHIPGYAPANSPPVTPMLTLAELAARFHTFLLDDYHVSIHSATGCAPQARWETAAFLPRLPDSLEALDLLLLTVAKPRRIHQDGIRFQGLRYVDTTLAGYIGEAVTVRYDPQDMAELRVYHQEHFLCRAVCQEIADQTISLRDILHARNERRRQLQTKLRGHAAVVDRLLTVHQPDPPASTIMDEARPRLKRYKDE